MTDRALIFVASLLIAVCALGAAVWLIAAGQLGTFDGNFLFLSAIVVAGAFGLYLKFMISRAMESAAAMPAKAAPANAEEAKASAPEPVAKA